MLSLQFLPSFSQIVLTVAALVSLRALYRLLFSPLSRYPGPLLARVTNLWWFSQYLTGRSHLVLQRLHKHHGSVVRIAPNTLSFASLEAWEAIYGFGAANAFDRGDHYNFGRDPKTGFSSVFAARTAAVHREHRKRVVGNALTASKIPSYVPVIEKNVSALMSRLSGLLELHGSPVDIVEAVHKFTFNTSITIIFGDTVCADEMLKSEYWANIETTFRKRPHLIWGAGYWPFLGWLFSTEPVVKITRRPRKDEKGRVKGIGGLMVMAFDLLYKHPQEAIDSEQPSLVGAWLSLPEEDSRKMSAEQMMREAMNLSFAGPDSTAAGLTMCLWELGQYPKWQEKIAAGDKEAMTAVLKETLRLHAPFPTAFPRSVAVPGQTIPGATDPLPVGTTVGVNAWLLGRSRELWGDDAEQWKPERWLNGDKIEDKFVAFGGKGPRACVGKDIAMLAIEKAVTAIVGKWEVTSQGKLEGRNYLEMKYYECTLNLKGRE